MSRTKQTMTSRVGRKKPSPEPARPAFTLLEMVLAIVLVALLAGVAVGVFWGTLEKAEIDAGAERIGALLRSIRAEAALTGRRFRLTFDADTSRPIVTIERDGLGQPGVFTPYQAWWINRARLADGVAVVSCERTGDSALDETGDYAAETGRQEDLDEITFHPDGSSDSARIVLATNDEERHWSAEITLNGIDGTITTREIDIEEEIEK